VAAAPSLLGLLLLLSPSATPNHQPMMVVTLMWLVTRQHQHLSLPRRLHR
jgi:hypothetical protein